MADYLELTCPGCQRKLRIRTKYIGLRVACSHCQHNFLVEAPEGTAASGPTPSGYAPAPPDLAAEQQRVAELDSELQQLRQQLADRAAECAQATEQLREAETRHAEERRELEADRSRIEEQVEQLKRQVQEAHELQPRLAQVREAEQRLESELSRIRAEAEGLQRERDEALGQLQTIGKNCEQLTARCDQLEARCQEAESARRDVEQRLETEQGRLNEAIRQGLEREAQLTRQNELQAEEIRRLQAKLAQPRRPEQPAADDPRVAELTQQLQQAHGQIRELRSLVEGLGISVAR
jgi:chromosome segregation ATPase